MPDNCAEAAQAGRLRSVWSPMSPRSRQEPSESFRLARELLLAHLNEYQAADLMQSHCFNVRDALGYLWRVQGGYGLHGLDVPTNDRFPNLCDQNGIGRTMLAIIKVSDGRAEFFHDLPMDDLALSLLFSLGTEAGAKRIHNSACPNSPRTRPPQHPSFASVYAGSDLTTVTQRLESSRYTPL